MPLAPPVITATLPIRLSSVRTSRDRPDWSWRPSPQDHLAAVERREPQVAQAAHVSKRVVSQFTADRRPVVERIESDLLGRRPPADDECC